jgi:hypothetical protein
VAAAAVISTRFGADRLEFGCEVHPHPRGRLLQQDIGRAGADVVRQTAIRKDELLIAGRLR